MDERIKPMKEQLQLTVFGTRGSMAVCRNDSMLFGGNTSCYMIRAGEQTVFLDGGSGLVFAPTEFEIPPVILLSHLHLDHILGLGVYRRLLQKGKETVIYLPPCSPEELTAGLDGVYAPPYWPLRLTEYAGTVKLQTFPERLQLGELSIETMHGYHPGDSLVFRIRWKKKCLVYASDCEPTEESTTELVEFVRGADLLLFDAQYTEEEYPARIGFGHSTAEKGIEIKELGNVKQLLLVHHDPLRNDAELLAMERKIGREDVRFAREGETIYI